MTIPILLSVYAFTNTGTGFCNQDTDTGRAGLAAGGRGEGEGRGGKHEQMEGRDKMGKWGQGGEGFFFVVLLNFLTEFRRNFCRKI